MKNLIAFLLCLAVPALVASTSYTLNSATGNVAWSSTAFTPSGAPGASDTVTINVATANLQSPSAATTVSGIT